jgi:hypothetical protein
VTLMLVTSGCRQSMSGTTRTFGFDRSSASRQAPEAVLWLGCSRILHCHGAINGAAAAAAYCGRKHSKMMNCSSNGDDTLPTSP